MQNNSSNSKYLLVKKITFILLFFISGNLHANILFEPHVGYIVKGGQDSYGPFHGTYRTYKYTGPQYGAKLGIKYYGFISGIQFNYSKFTVYRQSPGLMETNSDQKQEEYGLFVGYNLKSFLRTWITYSPYARITQTNVGTSGELGTYFEGTSLEIGLGYRVFRLMNLNLAYRMITYSKDHDASTGLVTDLSPQMELKEYVLSASFPMNFL